MIEIREYLDENNHSPYGRWFISLNPQARAKIVIALTRISMGNISNVKPVGGGVHEYRIAFGPGYRIYFGWDGDRLVILLCGGTKKRQQADIETAKSIWQDYKRSKPKERSSWH